MPFHIWSLGNPNYYHHRFQACSNQYPQSTFNVLLYHIWNNTKSSKTCITFIVLAATMISNNADTDTSLTADDIAVNSLSISFMRTSLATKQTNSFSQERTELLLTKLPVDVQHSFPKADTTNQLQVSCPLLCALPQCWPEKEVSPATISGYML